MDRLPERARLAVTRPILFDGEEAVFSFDLEILRAYAEHGTRGELEIAAQVQGVVQDPTVVFAGLNRKNHDDCFCYVGYPGGCYSESADKWRAGYVVLAYGRPLDSELMFFDADLSIEEGRTGWPANWQGDFGEGSVKWHRKATSSS